MLKLNHKRKGHFETIWPVIKPTKKPAYLRKTITLSDGDFLDIDTINNQYSKAIIFLHGLEGSSNSHYIKRFVNYFSKKEFNIYVVNFRSCSGRNNLKLQSYHSGATHDLYDVLNQLVINVNKSIYMIGFSLGANVLLNFLCEPNAQNYAIRGAAAISVPADLAGCANQLASAENQIYMKRFLNSLNKKIIAKSKQFPNQLSVQHINTLKTFYQWDNEYTAPIHGFGSAQEYYQQCSSLFKLNQIHTPVLILNAQNDPFLNRDSILIKTDNPLVTVENPLNGGHCGFLNSKLPQKNIAIQRVEEFIKHC